MIINKQVKMRSTNILYLLFISFSLLMACGANKGTTITGKIANAGNMSIFLDKVGLSQVSNVRIASDKTDGTGSYTFNMPEGIKKGIYRVTIGTKGFELVSDGTEKEIVVNGDLNTLQNMELEVKGSPLSEQFVATVKGFINQSIDVNKLKAMAESESNPLVAFMIASRMFTFREDFADVHTKVAARLQKEAPDVDFLADYQNIVTSLNKQADMRLAAMKIKPGMDAPEIALPGVDGKIMKLSDYKGKVVLLDFWASWCGPCRKENPKVVEIYNKYKDKGFDIFSVSLDGVDERTRKQIGDATQIKMNEDRSREKWLGAIQADNLSWKGHVSDLMKWNSTAAATYGVSSIPQTFLIGRDGKIAAVNPRTNLEMELQRVL